MANRAKHVGLLVLLLLQACAARRIDPAPLPLPGVDSPSSPQNPVQISGRPGAAGQSGSGSGSEPGSGSAGGAVEGVVDPYPNGPAAMPGPNSGPTIPGPPGPDPSPQPNPGPGPTPPLPLPESPVLGDTPLADNRNILLGAPRDRQNRPEIRISRRQYVLSWNPERHTINWVAWMLEPSDLGSVGRRDHFSEDPDLAAYTADHGQHAVGPDDYAGSCFDRGHQVPSGDRTNTDADNAATFEMSNIIPQAAYMNRVLWEHLEERERALAKASASHMVLIVAGPIFGPNPAMIGPAHDIAVPARNFKVIVPLNANRSADASTPVIAVSMPNLTSTGTDAAADHAQACADSKSSDTKPSAGSPDDWQAYVTTLGALEAEAGFDLLTALPAATHTALASKPPQK